MNKYSTQTIVASGGWGQLYSGGKGGTLGAQAAAAVLSPSRRGREVRIANSQLKNFRNGNMQMYFFIHTLHRFVSLCLMHFFNPFHVH